MSNNAPALLDVLFETLQSLTDRDDPIDIERANAIRAIVSLIINICKAGIASMRTAGGGAIGTDFIPVLPASAQDPEQGAQQIPVAEERQTRHGKETVTPIQGGVLRRHVIR